MPRGRPGLNMTDHQIEDFQRALERHLTRQKLTPEQLAEQMGFSTVYAKLLLGHYAETHRAPSANVLARLRENGFKWSPPSPSQTTASEKSRKPGKAPARRKRTQHVQLVQRDEETILFLAHAVLALRTQIQQLFFPSEATATRRLRQLSEAQFLQRYRPPAASLHGRLAGSCQYVYGLGKCGANLATEYLGRRVQPAIRKGKNPGNLFLAHRLEITEFAVQMSQAAGDELVEWDTNAALEDQVTVRGRKRRLRPDGYFVLRLSDGTLRHMLLEMDCNTMGRRAWLAKLAAYQAYYRSGAYGRRYGTDRLLLLVVVPDDTRRRWLQRTVQTAQPVMMVFLATWADVDAHSATGPAWARYDTGAHCDLWVAPERRT